VHAERRLGLLVAQIGFDRANLAILLLAVGLELSVLRVKFLHCCNGLHLEFEPVTDALIAVVVSDDEVREDALSR